MPEDKTIAVNGKAFDKLTWAKKKDESYSDVIIRLVSTNWMAFSEEARRKSLRKTTEDSILSIDQSLCMGAESCVSLAPEVFALDASRVNDSPLAMRDVMDREVPSEKILAASQTCPYKAINIVDAETGEQLFP